METLRKVLAAPDLANRSFHDNTVHAFHLSDEKPDEGTSTLTLDIDHIVEWIEVPGHFEFEVAPGLLSFFGVFRLKLELDYSVGPIGVTPFSIDRIESTTTPEKYGTTVHWRIPINSPTGLILFEAADWSLTLIGPSVRSRTQSLTRQTLSLDV
jgi:hypothetical protein